jgi:hypothetical protein
MKKSKARTKIDPTTLKSRVALAKMVTKLFALWKLSTGDQLALLGFATSGEDHLERYRKGDPMDNDIDLLNRVAILLSIHRSLRIIFPRNRAMVYNWPTTPNRAFENRSPVEFIDKYGLRGLQRTQHYLDEEFAEEFKLD